MKVDARRRRSLLLRGLRVCSLATFAFALVFAAPSAVAQSTGGRIRGTVTDPSGGAVAAATVTLINAATSSTRVVQSGANGEYIFIEVPVGSYEIDVTQAGFKKFIRAGVSLQAAGSVAWHR